MLKFSGFSLVWFPVVSLALGRKSQRPLKHTKDPFDENFAQLVDFSLKQWHVPGLSIAVVDGHEIWAEVCLLDTLTICLIFPGSRFND
jgi:hypothetical protein